MSNDALSEREIDAKIETLVYGTSVVLKPCVTDPESGWMVAREPDSYDPSDIELHPCRLRDFGPSYPEGHKWEWQNWEIVANYSTDLNACAEAERRCIEKVGWKRYQIALSHIYWVTRDIPPDAVAPLRADELYWTDPEFLVTATAHQRCLAMLACMEEEK